MEKYEHKPVMYKEAIEYLDPKPGDIIIDATVGLGGHTEELIKRVRPGGRVIGIDRDEESLSYAGDRLKDYADSLLLVHGDFRQIDEIMRKLGIDKVDGILYDFGLSSFQIQDAKRGFSFNREGPLDMRMDRNSYISAYDLVNNLTESEISNILKLYGQERWHNRIARFVVQERSRSPISTTTQLSNIVLRSMPYHRGHWHIHPATRTFMALRIAVNRELEAIDSSLIKSADLLNKGGRICAISFHSLEDRIVKNNFKKLAKEGRLKIVTAKPLRPSFLEIRENRRARSAKFRVAERA
ncbi:MAG: 16S rRNA (cytosine(1402)-N(4))-methyltransferase RsmH [Candidatus Omnitrophica bacterium]|nr:16S rRNA (cytosine(1402)-N(4))-methyltransferase RsmH [Candidatus Omnitrophota bacterium]